LIGVAVTTGQTEKKVFFYDAALNMVPESASSTS